MNIILNILFLILAILLLFLLLILFIKVRVVFKINKSKGNKAEISLQIWFLGGCIKKDIPLKSGKAKKNKSEEIKNETELKFIEKVKKYYSDFLKFYSVYKENSKRIRKSLYAEKIILSVNFGLGDAARTGIATGTVWAGIYNVISFVSKIIRIKEPKINIIPEYNEFICEVSGECIIGGRPVNLIITALGLYKSYKRVMKTK